MDYYEEENDRDLNILLAKIAIACLIGVLIVFSMDSYMDRHTPKPCSNTGTSQPINKSIPNVVASKNNRV